MASITWTFSPGDTIESAKVNQNFTDSITDIDNSNIAAAAAIAASKLDLVNIASAVRFNNGVELQWENNASAADAKIYESAADVLTFSAKDHAMTATTGDIDIASTAGDITFLANAANKYAKFITGTEMRVYDAADTEYFTISHTGTNAVLGTNTGNVHVFDSTHNIVFRVFGSGGGNNIVDLIHDNSHGYLRSQTGDLIMIPASGTIGTTGSVRPTADNTYSCGTGAGGGGTRAWTNVSSYVYTTASDERVKEEIKDMGSALEKTKQVRTVEYQLMDESPKKNGKKTKHIGVLAQQLKEVLPEVVYDPSEDPSLTPEEAENANLGVRYNELTVHNMKAIQELVARVEALEA